jgi:hypothetical protein
MISRALPQALTIIPAIKARKNIRKLGVTEYYKSLDVQAQTPLMMLYAVEKLDNIESRRSAARIRSGHGLVS